MSKTFFARNRDTYERVKAALRAQHPELFDGNAPKPLHVRIDREIKAAHPELTNREIYVFLSFWCRRKEYHRAMFASEQRHGLNGEPTPLKQAHRERAWRWGRVPGEPNPFVSAA